MDEPISFSSGDVIVIKKVTDYSTIEVGDVISFVSYNPGSMGKTLTHKVRAIITTASGRLIGFETYGINTGESDEAIVEPSTILGEYSFMIPNLGYLFSFFKTPAGYFTSILVPCLLLIIFFSIKVGKWIAKREMAKSYDAELALLKDKLSQLENRENGDFIMLGREELAMTTDTGAPMQQEQLNAQTEGASANTTSEQPQQVFTQPQQGGVYVPFTNVNDKTLELTVGALNRTIDTLSRTIENLAMAVEKPVDTLARTVETLASATTRPTVVEKIIKEPVVVQPQVTVQPQMEVQPQPIVQPQVEEQAKAEEVDTVVEVLPEENNDARQEIVESEQEQTSIFDKFKNVREKVPFNKKLLSLDSEIKNHFSDVHNELKSYKKLNHRISSKGVSYRVGRDAIAKMAVRGKTLKLYLDLDVNEYPKTVYFQEDSSNVKKYEEVPFTVKIKSKRGKNNAIKLISSLAEKKNLVKNEQFKQENVLKELKAIK